MKCDSLKRLYAIGILIVSIAGFGFFLGGFGKGGVPISRDSSRHSEDFSDGVDFILFNHGRITPISEQYFDLVRRTDSANAIIAAISLPFLLCGLVPALRKHGYRDAKWWPELFIPTRREPPLTFFAKLYYLLLFLALIGFMSSGSIGGSERAYIVRILLAYIVCITMSALVTGLVHRTRSAMHDDAISMEEPPSGDS